MYRPVENNRTKLFDQNGDPMRRSCAVLTILLFGNLLAAQHTATRAHLSRIINNRDIIEMVTDAVPDDTIIEKIRTAEITNFDLSVAGIRSLKAARVYDAVIRAMNDPYSLMPNETAQRSTSSIPQQFSPSNSTPRLSMTTQVVEAPSEVGVYLVVKGKLMEVEPEIVGWQTGGVLKRIATVGFDHGHINGKVMHPKSPFRVNLPLEIIVRTVEGTSATEYQLLRLYEKGNRREFRAMTGGVFHASGGAERTAVEFEPEKIAPRTWRIRLNRLDPGEYGLLPPGISAASISASGKMYTFGVVE